MARAIGPDPGTRVVTTRYGVFLSPDTVTSAAVTAVTGFIRARYGLISAGAFPPHATLVGSLPLLGAETELIAVLDRALAVRSSFRVQNLGVRRLGEVVVYDVDELDGQQNSGLHDLARIVDGAVASLLAPTGGMPADRFDEDRFHGHLSLASHDLFGRPALRDEVAEFAAALPVVVPEEFLGDTVTLYRFEHPSWSGPWWEAMRWAHVRTWRLHG